VYHNVSKEMFVVGGSPCGDRMLLGGNLLETLPAELCTMFPNAVDLFLHSNRLRTLPRELGQMQRLQQ
jgi:hypothetical protein